MCCRFYISKSPEIQTYTEKAQQSSLTSPMTIALSRPFKTEGEIRPTDIVSVIAPSRSGKETVFPMVWGFTIPRSNNPVVNARVETAKDRDIFRESWEHRRCAIPCSWYYEWEHLKNEFTGKSATGDKYMIQPRNTAVTFLAGLYRMESSKGIKYPVFTVLTRDSAPGISFIHDRMPVILPQTLVGDWINPENKADEIVSEALNDMVFEKAV
ncbi:MAG: SOS response-associated peptidase family protein [Oscillospiraceae bacterium]|nr:SOS response-associated peptidase family protein [Oscillospiraceae bacterium]